MNCSARAPVLGAAEPGRRRLVTGYRDCGTTAEFRVGSTTDPWPLQYACPAHLVAAIRSMPTGDVRVSRLRPGQVTPQPRAYIGKTQLRVVEDDTMPTDRVEVRSDTDVVVIDAPTLDAATVSAHHRVVLPGRCPRVTGPFDYPCVLGDNPREHIAGHETARISGAVRRWDTDDADAERWYT